MYAGRSRPPERALGPGHRAFWARRETRCRVFRSVSGPWNIAQRRRKEVRGNYTAGKIREDGAFRAGRSLSAGNRGRPNRTETRRGARDGAATRNREESAAGDSAESKPALTKRFS